MKQRAELSALLDIINPQQTAEAATDSIHNQPQVPIDSLHSAQQWISGLESSGSVKAAKQLYQFVPQLMALKLEPSDKLRVLESLYPEVLQCTDRLLNRELNHDTAKAVSLGAALIRHLYNGYKSVIVGLARTAPQADKPLNKAILRSCQLLSKIQHHSFSHYMVRPKYFWRDLHSLYLLACILQIEQDQLIDIDGSHCQSIYKIYLKLLLLSCTRPNHFSTYELNFIYKELDFWSSMADLRKGSRGGLFVVDSTSNQGPVYADRVEPKADNLVLDTFNLVKFLNNSLLEKSNHNLFSNRVSRRVVVDLARQWGKKIVRQETHISDNAKVNIACGITSALCMLAKTDSFDSFLDLCGQPKTHNSVSAPAQSNDIWTPEMRNRQLGQNPNEPVLYEQQPKKPVKLSLHRGLRINTSLNGACIELVEDLSEMQPGKPIALRTRDSRRWAAGIIRWKQITPSLSVLCGIQFPAKYSAAAAIRSTAKGQRADRIFMPAIILSRGAELNAETSMLCPPLRYQRGGKIQLLTSSLTHIAILLEELETTEHLSHFKIAIY
ncbi:hypothetical protein N9N16_05510 [Porticoccaceae bacterium]|nr:hypothetical protein [Porticoccaceae bacterium]